MSYLIFDFVYFTLSSADTHGIAKYARTYIWDTHTQAHTQKKQKEKLERLGKKKKKEKVEKPKEIGSQERKKDGEKKKERTKREGGNEGEK